MQQIKNIIPKQLRDGVTGYYAHGENMTLGLVELKAGSYVPLHSHIHEQVTYLIEGEMKMNIGGKEYIFTPACYHVIPSNVLHDAYAVTDCKVIDAFAPVREEYKT